MLSHGAVIREMEESERVNAKEWRRWAMFVLSLNAFRQRCFHNFPTSIWKFIASNFFDRDCVAVHSLCVCVSVSLCFALWVQLSETYPIKSLRPPNTTQFVLIERDYGENGFIVWTHLPLINFNKNQRQAREKQERHRTICGIAGGMNFRKVIHTSFSLHFNDK